MVEQPSWFSTASDIAAWVSMPVAFASAWYARKALIIAEKKARREDADISMYLEDAFQISADGDSFIAIKATITNISDTPNSIMLAELERMTVVIGGINVPIKEKVVSRPFSVVDDGIDEFTLPKIFGPRQSFRCWIYFRETRGSITQPAPDSIRVIFYDSFAKSYTQMINLVRKYV